MIVDEAGGATKQVQEFRNLVQREKVDAVLGYVSSGDCMAVPQVAEELKAFLVLYYCGTPRVFDLTLVDLIGQSVLATLPMSVRPPAWSPAHRVTLGPGEMIDDLDFGNRQCVDDDQDLPRCGVAP